MIKKIMVILIVLSAAALILSAAGASMTPQERAEAYYRQGYLYYYIEDYNSAIAEYEKALDIDPNMAKAHYWIGKCYYQLKNYPQARKYVETSVSLSPGIDNGEGLLSRIQAGESATAPRPAPSRPAAPSTPQPVKVKDPGPKLITLDLRDVDISYALQLYSKETGENIIVSKDVWGKITIRLNNASTKEAFESIIQAGHCKYTIDDKGVIYVFPSEKAMKTQYLPGGIVNKTYNIEYVPADEMKTTLEKMLAPETKLITVPGTRALIVEGTQDEIRKAEIVIRNIDVPPKQVMVEARFIEIKHTADSNMGVNLKHTDPANPTNVIETVGLAGPPTGTGARGLYYSVTSGDIQGLLEALSSRTGYNLLASPKVLAIEGEESQIIMGARLGYKTKTVTTTGMVESVEFLDVGTKLVIKPQIKDDGHIIMDIHPEISEGSIVNELPQKQSTETTTKLLVKDGQTIIIGGLFRDMTQNVQRGVPLLADIPIIGAAFRRTDLMTEKRELIIFITPHIVTPDMIEAMGDDIENFEKRKKDEAYHSPLDLVR